MMKSEDPWRHEPLLLSRRCPKATCIPWQRELSEFHFSLRRVVHGRSRASRVPGSSTASGLSKARKSMGYEWRVPAHLMGWMKAGTRKRKSYLADLFLWRVRSWQLRWSAIVQYAFECLVSESRFFLFIWLLLWWWCLRGRTRFLRTISGSVVLSRRKYPDLSYGRFDILSSLTEGNSRGCPVDETNRI